MMVDVSKITCCFVYVIGIALAAPATVEFQVPSIELAPIDPVHVPSLKIDQGTGPVSIKLNFRDLDVSSLGTVKINELNADLDNNNFTLDVNFEKHITLDGNYDIKGKVIILPITGNGKGKISLDNVRAKINAHMKTVVKNEDTFMEIQDMSLKFTTSRMHIQLDNLFNGDKVLGNNMNTYLNENWKEILGELQSSIENSLITLISGIGQQLLSKVPLNQVLKE